VKVPADLLDTVKTFHQIRRTVQDGMQAINIEVEAFQRSVKDRTTRLDNKHTAALMVVRDALIEAKLISETQVFIIDTGYLDEHGEAFIRIEGDDPEAQPERTIH